jgi:hypothetical protein
VLLLVSSLTWSSARIRRVEDELPDVQVQAEETPAVPTIQPQAAD